MENLQHDNAAILRTIDDLFNARKLEEALAYIDADYVEMNIATGDTFQGPEGFKKSAQSWIDTFPDARIEILSQIACGDHITMEFIGRGTHSNPMPGPKGTIPPSGKTFEVRFCEIVHFRNGKVKEIRLYFDQLAMLNQLGIAGR